MPGRRILTGAFQSTENKKLKFSTGLRPVVNLKFFNCEAVSNSTTGFAKVRGFGRIE